MPVLEFVLIVFALVFAVLAALQVNSPRLGLIGASLACWFTAELLRRVAAFGLVLALLVAPVAAQNREMFGPAPQVLLSGATTTATGTASRAATIKRTFQVYGATSAGAGSATVVIEVSNVEAPGTNDWITAGTVTLTLSTTRATDGFTSDAPWTWVRARVTAISGTDAAVTALMGAGG